ncbi:YhgE/Pip domain-containing protein [Bacillus sp. REN10]|uniref:YhgE/Pip domain-containing protein n=1 Tax=Bacillus sp. REN10 TaxID=2782541 RepID=UPI00193BAEC0|nr:YhgE/Pip domain-containing protein [Bacillus sp. REN10]
MKQSLFFAELKEIIRTRKLLIPILAVLFIPLLYAGMFLWAFWDPYAHLKDLPVAVVNKDKGADFEGEKLTLGKELEKEIGKSDEFNFQIVSDKEARRGLEQQKYYMLIEIPPNFSKNATTLLEDEPKKLELKYIPNEGFNFLSSQIGETAMKEIRASLQESITKTYSETIFDKIKEMGDGLGKASDGAGALDEGAIDLSAGAEKIKANLGVLAEKSVQFSQGVSKAGNGTKALVSGASQLHSGLAQLEEGGNKLVAGGKELQSGTGELAAGISKVQGGLHTVDDKMNALTAGTEQAKAGVQQFQQKLPALTQGTQNLAAGAESLNSGLNQFEQQLISQLNGAMSQQIEKLMPALQQSMTPEQIAGLKQQMAQQQQQMEQQVKGAVGQLKSGTQQLAAGSRELNGAISGQLAPNINKLNSGLGELQQGQQQLKAGVHELASGADQLAGGVGKLQAGQKELLSGVGLLSSKLGEAEAGAAELASGATTLSNGFGQLDEGSNKISEGTKQLADGSKQLADGTTKLEEGTNDLHTKLADAADQANKVNATDDTNDMIANPVKVKKDAVNPVPNYGTGFAPYFLSLGLFVGALLLSIVFPLREPATQPKNGFSWFIGKFGVLLIAGVAQSVLAVLVLLVGLKIEVQSVPLFFLTAVITSLTFIALVQMLVTILGDPGRFVAILILIFQLTTSAGTFPLELIPNALQPFNALLPMTYSVAAFKAVISSGDYSFMWNNNVILGAFAVVCLILTIIFFQGMYKRQYGHQAVTTEK